LVLPRPPSRSPRFPYTTLFRSAKINGPGILLTSGDGTPPLSHTQTGYGDHTTGIAGSDADLQAIIDGAFDNAGVTQDASVLTFKDRKSTRLNSSHVKISYAVFC